MTIMMSFFWQKSASGLTMLEYKGPKIMSHLEASFSSNVVLMSAFIGTFHAFMSIEMLSFFSLSHDKSKPR